MIRTHFFIWVILLVLSIQPAAWPTEVDNFSVRLGLKDSREWLNRRMNAAITEAVEKTPACSLNGLNGNLYAQLGGALWSKIELWSRDNPGVVKIPFAKSIYGPTSGKLVSKFWFVPLWMNIFYTEGNLRVGKTILGDDKLGHFLQLGFDTYYWVNQKRDPELHNVQGFLEKSGDFIFGIQSFARHSKLKGDALAMALSEFSEVGQWGLQGPGVYSYADVVSNWEGYRFWTELTGGENPILLCQNERWKMARPFDWADYINPAWDEAINCSRAKSEIARLIHPPPCPVNPEDCKALVQHYGAAAPQLLHPDCLKAAEKGMMSPADFNSKK